MTIYVFCKKKNRFEVSSVVNCSRFTSSVVNCGRVFSSFTCVFQPYQMCEQQFSWYLYIYLIITTLVPIFLLSKKKERKRKRENKNNMYERKSCQKVLIKWLYEYHFSSLKYICARRSPHNLVCGSTTDIKWLL